MKYDFFRTSLHSGELTYDEIKELEQRYSIPLYMYDGNDAFENAVEIKGYLGRSVELCYAVKANYYLAESIVDLVDRFEVCTGREFDYCIRNHIPTDKISYSGVWKSPKEIRRALKAGVHEFVLDSVKQALELQEISKYLVKVFLRLSSGNQFGMRVEEIAQIIEDRSTYSRLNVAGIHYYAGTQRCMVRQLKEDFEKLIVALEYLKNKGLKIEEIQVGGGLGTPLYQSDRIQEYEETADYLFEFIRDLSKNYKITYECGRAIASNAGRYLTQVFERKERENKEILLVHGGSHHLKYYGNIVGQRTPFIDCVERTESEEEHEYMICGELCSSNDILSMKYIHSRVETGDYMIFYNVGAYSLQEAASLFLTMEMPEILIYNKNIGVKKILELGWASSERRDF